MKTKAKKVRNPVAVAMFKRYGTTTTEMADRRLSRPEDFKNSWKREADLDIDDDDIECEW